MKEKYRVRHIILGDNIRKLRKAYGCSQETLAAKLSLKRSTLAKIENASSTARLDVLFKISEVFNVPITDLLGCDEWEK